MSIKSDQADNKITYEEHDRHVQHEGNHGVGKQSPDTDVVDVVHGEVGNLEEQSGDTVHHSANRSKVVQRDDGVHLVLGRAEKALHHDQSGGLKDDTTNLEQESNKYELDLTDRSNDDTENDDAHVKEDPQVDRGHSHGPSSQQHSDRGGSLYGTVSTAFT